MVLPSGYGVGFGRREPPNRRSAAPAEVRARFALDPKNHAREDGRPGAFESGENVFEPRAKSFGIRPRYDIDRDPPAGFAKEKIDGRVENRAIGAEVDEWTGLKAKIGAAGPSDEVVLEQSLEGTNGALELCFGRFERSAVELHERGKVGDRRLPDIEVPKASM